LRAGRWAGCGASAAARLADLLVIESTLLIALRRATPALGTRASTRVVCADYPLAYVRGVSHLIVVNPRREPATFTAPEAAGAIPVWGAGVARSADGLVVAGFGYGVLRLPAS
jgi:maltose alpha-D-glucosyltransferase/alpha-amylase